MSGTDVVDGRRAVVAMVGVAVCLAGILGYVLGNLGVTEAPFGRIGPVAVPLNPVSLAVYGVMMTGVPLAVLLGVVHLLYARSNGASTTE